ncbi:MAG: tetratricopeptide repeat protein, partial [Anaerolineae bacterium]
MNPEQARLGISLLGSFRVTLDGEPVTDFVSDKVRALLAYLAVEADRPHRRERLAGMLWPDYPDRDARGSLHTALKDLRTVIGDRVAEPRYLHVTRQTIQFNRDSDSWVDVAAFNTPLMASHVSPDTDPQVIVQLEEAIAWYRGDFLEGFCPADCLPFEEWALSEQESLRRQAWEALERLVTWYEERGEVDRALRYARRQVNLDPLHESAHRHVMRLLALSGQRAAALKQYEICCQVLQAELDVGPDDKTTQLREQILSRGLTPSATAPRPSRYAYVPSLPPDPGELPEPGDLPPGSRLPFGRNALFTGRQRPLLTLARALLHDRDASTLITQTIQGMGGIGKTQLAVEFAYRYGRSFHGVHWLNCAQPDLLPAEIAACGEKMLLPGWPDEQPQQVERTLRAWHDGHRLIILDNLEDLDIARDWLPSLAGPDLRILVTARRSDWPRDLGLAVLPLELFSPTESHVFLRRYLPADRAPDTQLDTLSERLGYLPLALRLAGRYLARHPRLLIDAYLDQLTDLLEHPSMAGFRIDLGDPVGHDLDLAATFFQSWQHVDDDGARRVFLLAGHCAPNQPIPCHLLERAADLDQDACDAAISLLTGLGLLQLDDAYSGPTIHPLLAEYSRMIVLLADESGRDLDMSAEQDFLPLPALCAASLSLAGEANELSSPARFSPLRPHIEAAAPAAQAAGLEEAGALWNELGRHLEIVAEYPGARRAIDRALGIDEAAFGPGHPHVARDLNSLAMLLRTLSDYEAAQAACRRALAIDEAALGLDHPDVARDYGNLGTVLWSMGDHQPAKAALQRALEIFDGAPEAHQIMAAQTHSHMGLLLADMGDYTGALTALQRAVAIGETVLASDHPEMGSLINNQGLALWYLGDPAGARDAFQRALTITEAAFHPN